MLDQFNEFMNKLSPYANSNDPLFAQISKAVDVRQVAKIQAELLRKYPKDKQGTK